MPSEPFVALPEHGFPSLDQEQRLISEAGYDLRVGSCHTVAEVLEVCADAQALLVQHTQITAEIIAGLQRCRIMVRYGVSVAEIDVAAATKRGIAVCNVPDYGMNEVADHTLSLALTAARQIPQIDKRLRDGIWKYTPDRPMPTFSEMSFMSAGFGRIGREVLARAQAFKFHVAAYDPMVPDAVFDAAGVRRVSLDELFAEADILSLHLPLTSATAHLLDGARLKQMKTNAIVVNTARGGLIDTTALVSALNSGEIVAAALDVYEDEPLPAGHELLCCPNAILTSHVAWFSDSSGPRLQRMAAEEVIRGLRGEPLRNQVNREVERVAGSS